MNDDRVVLDKHRFVERVWWMVIYGAMILIAADRVDSGYGWVVVIGSALLSGFLAASGQRD